MSSTNCVPSLSDYRLLTSPLKRIFWNIPTHSEWAIKSIQAEGTRYEHERASSSDPELAHTPKLPGVHDHGFYTAHHNKTKGHLIISDVSIRFVSNISHDVHWVLPYSQITQLEKVNRLVQKAVPTPQRDSGKDLRIVDKQGKEVMLVNVDSRDQAFSQIVGFSDTVWQVVW